MFTSFMWYHLLALTPVSELLIHRLSLDTFLQVRPPQWAVYHLLALSPSLSYWSPSTVNGCTKPHTILISYSASVKVLNWGLGPHEDQTAEMVLIWSSFYTKVLIFHWRGSLLTAAGWGWLIRDTIESNTINACAILNCDVKEYFSLFHSHWQSTSIP